MRSQWVRARLVGPISLATFSLNDARFFTAVSSDAFFLLKKALVWFQAEKTIPNAQILASAMPKDQRLQYADLLGWPSDVPTWGNLISFIIRRLNSIPKKLYPDIVAVFEVWQNLDGGFPNPVSQGLFRMLSRRGCVRSTPS